MSRATRFVARHAHAPLVLAAWTVIHPHVGFANSGVQLPLSQYSAGSETTNNTIVTNGGFEQPGVAGPNATGWTPMTDQSGPSPAMSVGAPDAAHLPSPASAIGNFSAKGGSNNINFNNWYQQTVTLAPNTEYVISGYLWSYGISGNPPHNDISSTGDLAVLQLRDNANFFNTAGVALEPTAVDNGSGANGYFVYRSFNSGQFSDATPTLEVMSDPNENNLGARPTTLAQFDNVSITPASQFAAQKWNSATGGNWSDGSKWLNGVPNNVGFVLPQGNVEGSAIATFGNTIAAPATVTLDSAKGVAGINFDSAVSYTIDGPSTLTFAHQEDRDGVFVNVNQGTHTIAAPVVIRQPTSQGITNFGPRNFRVTVTPANAALTITTDVVSSGTSSFNLFKSGAGRLAMKNVRVGRLNINAGTVSVIVNNSTIATSSVQTLTIAGGPTTPTATFDIGDHDLIVRSGPKSDVESLVKFARNGGTWNANGISSSAAATNGNHTTGLGVLSGSEYTSVGGNGTFEGLAYASTDTLVKYTWNGDANFDGRVTFDDYVKIDTGFNTHLTGWLNGDFNYSGAVNFDDYVLIDVAFNQQNGTLGRAIDWISGDDRSGSGRTATGVSEMIEHFEEFGSTYGAAFLSAVPEPVAVPIACLGCCVASRRRARRDER